jgi:hypothetical protein
MFIWKNKTPSFITFLKWNRKLKRLETKPRAQPRVSIIGGDFVVRFIFTNELLSFEALGKAVNVTVASSPVNIQVALDGSIAFLHTDYKRVLSPTIFCRKLHL